MSKITQLLGSALVLGCGFLLPMTAAAVDLGNGWSPSPLELFNLPDYCQKQFLSKNDPKVYQALSPGCDGIHHYCAGKVLLLRTTDYSIPAGERRRIFGQAKKEIGYMASRLTPSCSRLGDLRATEETMRMLEPQFKK